MLKVEVDKKKKLNSWDQDNFTKNKLKTYYTTQFPKQPNIRESNWKKNLNKKEKNRVVGRKS